MAIVVRPGPHRRGAERARTFCSVIERTEVFSVAGLLASVMSSDVVAVPWAFSGVRRPRGSGPPGVQVLAIRPGAHLPYQTLRSKASAGRTAGAVIEECPAVSACVSV